MQYLGVSKSTAIKIKSRAIKECNGAVSFGSHFVKTDAVLALYSTTRSHELILLNEVINNENKSNKENF